jgi:hypothetical protein
LPPIALLSEERNIRAEIADRIETAIARGEMLEEYPNDPRGESCLILGYVEERPLRIVLGWAGTRGRAERTLRLITVYVPRPPK